MRQSRLATLDDLEPLLRLFAEAKVSAHATPLERARDIWQDTMLHDGVFVFVSDEGPRIVSTCMLITAPNLLRESRKHGYIDNVVTHDDFQRKGHGRAVIEAALAKAWAEDCYHVMLQSGRKDPSVHRFYETCGFVAGLRTAYVARNPGMSRPPPQDPVRLSV